MTPSLGRVALPGLTILSSLALLWLASPLFDPILWAVVFAILFKPVDRRIAAMLRGRRTTSALLTLLLIVAVLIIPGILLATAIANEIIALYSRGAAGAFDIGQMLAALRPRLPTWAAEMLERSGLSDNDGIAQWASANLAAGLRALAQGVLSVGQRVLAFLAALGVSLYLTFFLLRDGEELAARLGATWHPNDAIYRELSGRFVSVVRATISGAAAVAVVQGTLGGLLFWAVGVHGALLWGTAMAAASLVPIAGTGFIWVPTGIYLLLTGHVWQGATVLLCGGLVISTIDSLIRPAVVGRGTQMPDWLAMVAIVGGIQAIGLSGIIAGPIVAGLFLSCWKLFLDSRKIEMPAISSTGTGTD